MGLFDKIKNGVAKVAKAVVNVAVDKLANITLAPLKPFIDLGESIYEGLKGAKQQPPVQPMPPPSYGDIFPMSPTVTAGGASFCYSPTMTAGGGSSSASQLLARFDPGSPPDPNNFPNDDIGKRQYEAKLQEYQNKLQAYGRMMQMLTQIQQAQHDMQKGVIQNFRV